MLPEELTKKIRHLQITTKKSVDQLLAGQYRSAFKGSGIEFEEVREYTPGDEIRAIDWNVTARTGIPFVKHYREERELSVFFLVDLSASGRFGSGAQTKNELAAELCALLGFAAAKSNDKCGLILFTDKIEKFIPPGKGSTHAMRIVREVLSFAPQGRGTSIKNALEYTAKILPRRSVLFLISDFQDENYEKILQQMAHKHDLIAMPIYDPREMNLPETGLIYLQDPETGEDILLDCGNADVRRQYADNARQTREALLRFLKSSGASVLSLCTGADYSKELAKFFQSR